MNTEQWGEKQSRARQRETAGIESNGKRIWASQKGAAYQKIVDEVKGQSNTKSKLSQAIYWIYDMDKNWTMSQAIYLSYRQSIFYTLPKVVYWCYCEFIRLYQQKDQRTLKKSKKRHQKSTSRQHESKSGRGHNSIYYNRLNTGSQYGKFFDAWTILQALTIT